MIHLTDDEARMVEQAAFELWALTSGDYNFEPSCAEFSFRDGFRAALAMLDAKACKLCHTSDTPHGQAFYPCAVHGKPSQGEGV